MKGHKPKLPRDRDRDTSSDSDRMERRTVQPRPQPQLAVSASVPYMSPGDCIAKGNHHRWCTYLLEGFDMTLVYLLWHDTIGDTNQKTVLCKLLLLDLLDDTTKISNDFLLGCQEHLLLLLKWNPHEAAPDKQMLRFSFIAFLYVHSYLDVPSLKYYFTIPTLVSPLNSLLWCYN